MEWYSLRVCRIVYIDKITHMVYNEKYKGEIITIIKQRHATLKMAEKGKT